MINLDPDNLRRGLKALEGLGYRPKIPVTMDDFTDRDTRERWIREKGMQVFGLLSDQHPETPIDVFVTEPFDFETEYSSAYREELSPGLDMPFVRLETLIRMKDDVGRPGDVEDARHLRWILEDRHDE